MTAVAAPEKERAAAGLSKEKSKLPLTFQNKLPVQKSIGGKKKNCTVEQRSF